jgi:hypothetical protein
MTFEKIHSQYSQLISAFDMQDIEILNPFLDSVSEVEPVACYAIVSPQRTGSTLLCKYFLRNEMGIPFEYLNWHYMTTISPRLGGEMHKMSYRRKRAGKDLKPEDCKLLRRVERVYLDAVMKRRTPCTPRR